MAANLPPPPTRALPCCPSISTNDVLSLPFVLIYVMPLFYFVSSFHFFLRNLFGHLRSLRLPLAPRRAPPPLLLHAPPRRINRGSVSVGRAGQHPVPLRAAPFIAGAAAIDGGA